ncbi:MAG: ATP-dependent DNA helicase [Elusimicrobiota bacterium]|nr:ATP-dependent DNA helicase [Elusimicrobiota bacterium]
MALEFITGPPGSGKKEYIKNSIKEYLKKSGSKEPFLILTHSAAAAQEIYEDTAPYLGSFKELWIESITSFCKKILRENYFNTGVKPGFRIISDFEKRLIVRAVLGKAKNLKYFSSPAGNEGLIKELANFTDIAKRNPGWEEKIKNLENSSALKFRDLKKLLDSYNRALKKFNFLDFVDIETETARLLKNYPETADFKKVYIYETEDMDKITVDIIVSLFSRAKSGCVTFRADAGIYDFRGADPGYMQKSLKDNFEFKEKELKRTISRPAEKIINASTRDKQAEKIASHIALKLKEGASPKDIAILSRSVGDDLGVLADALKRRGINYVLSGGIGFFRQPDIVEFISLLTVIYRQAECEDIHLYRAGKMTGLAGEELFNSLRRQALLESKPVKTVFKEELPELYKNFFSTIANYRRRAKTESIEKFIYRLLTDFNLLKDAAYNKLKAELYGYFYRIVKEYSEHYEKLLGRPLKFSEFMENLYDLLKGFGKDIDVPFISDREAVKIMTVQQSKGEIYRTVYIVDMVEDVFPRRFFENPLITAAECEVLNIIPDMGISARYEYEKRLFNIARSRAGQELIYGAYEIDSSGAPAKKSSFIDGDGEIEELAGLDAAVIDNFDLFIKLASEYSLPQRTLISENVSADIAREIEKIEKIIEFDPRNLNDRVKEGLPGRYSYTKLENFVNCPRQFFYRYIAGLREPESIYKVIGIAAHSVLSDLHDSGEITENNMNKILNEHWADQNFYSEFESRNVYTLIKRMLENYLRLAQTENFKVISTEEVFHAELGEREFTGRFDRIDKLPDGGERVVDYKTGSAVPAIRGQLNAVKRGESFQIPIYSAARACRYFSIYRLRVEPDKMNVMIDLNQPEAAKALQEGLKAIKETVSSLEEGIFVPEKTSACRVCYFKRICTAQEIKK